MDYGLLLGVLHQFVGWLLYPVIAVLGIALALTLLEVGLALAERFYTLPALATVSAEEQRSVCAKAFFKIMPLDV